GPPQRGRDGHGRLPFDFNERTCRVGPIEAAKGERAPERGGSGTRRRVCRFFLAIVRVQSYHPRGSNGKGPTASCYPPPRGKPARHGLVHRRDESAEGSPPALLS